MYTNTTSAVSASTLPLMEVFASIQGEGCHQGMKVCFIRLAGCEVGCHWCDTKDSWAVDAYPRVSVPEIVQRVQALVSDDRATVVVTGGEPLMHQLGPLTEALRAVKLRVHLETSGAYPLTGTWDWICISPKKRRRPHETVLRAAHELKCVIYNRDDLAWAAQHARLATRAQCFLQPEWSVRTRILPRVLAYMTHHPHWRLSLQTHKYMCIP